MPLGPVIQRRVPGDLIVNFGDPGPEQEIPEDRRARLHMRVADLNWHGIFNVEVMHPGRVDMTLKRSSMKKVRPIRLARELYNT
jgi:hypothetical protein